MKSAEKVICTNCGAEQSIRTEAEFKKFQETWTETLTQDICPSCDGAQLSELVERMLNAEKQLYSERD